MAIWCDDWGMVQMTLFYPHYFIWSWFSYQTSCLSFRHVMPLWNESPSNSPRFSDGWNHPLLYRSHPFQIAICRSCQRFQWHIHQVTKAKTNHHTQAVQAMFCSENSLRFSSYKPCICGILMFATLVLLKSWVAFQFLRLSNLSRKITIPPPEPSVDPQSWGLGHCGYSSFLVTDGWKT